jgi:cell division septal protein FtsQ
MNSPVKRLAFIVSISTATLLAQQDRIMAPLDPTSRVVLRGNVHVKAQPLYDRGRVDPTLEISYVTLLLKPSPDQQVSLDRLLADQQEPSSPSHHK